MPTGLQGGQSAAVGLGPADQALVKKAKAARSGRMVSRKPVRQSTVAATAGRVNDTPRADCGVAL
jgi:hypothetical protein